MIYLGVVLTKNWEKLGKENYNKTWRKIQKIIKGWKDLKNGNTVKN